MSITQTWTSPAEGGSLDLATGATVTAAVWENLMSDVNRLGGANGALLTTDAGLVLINDTTNAKSTIGLTINQGANDDEALALKSSDIAHGITDLAETDTYGSLGKQAALTGGLMIRGYTEDEVAVEISALSTNDDTGRATTANGVISLSAYKKSGTGFAAPGANANLLVVSSGANTRFLVDQEGDIHMDATSNINAWDDHDDLALLETYRLLSGANFRARFAQNMDEHAEVLGHTGVLTLNDDGHHFVSVKGLFGLMIDGMRQMGGKLAATEERLRLAEARLSALPGGA